MRLAVIADIHGVLPALEAALSAIRPHYPDRILVAGDMIGGGPNPNRVLERLADLDALMILGNHEDRVLQFIDGGGPAGWRERDQWAFTRWTIDRLAPASVSLLRGLDHRVTLPQEGQTLDMIHASPGSNTRGFFTGQEPELIDAIHVLNTDLLITAHTHYQWHVQRNGWQAVNPGSVGAPGGAPSVPFAILDWQDAGWHVSLHQVDAPLTAIRRAYEKSGALEEAGPLAKAWLLTAENQHDFVWAFVMHLQRVVGQADRYDGVTIDDDLWQHAAETFDWHSPPA